MMGMVTGSYDVAAMIVTPLISYMGGSRKKPVFCAWCVFAMGVGFFIFMLPHFVSPPYEAGMSTTIGRSLHISFVLHFASLAYAHDIMAAILFSQNNETAA